MVLPNNVYHSENQLDRKESERRWKWRERLGAAVLVGDRVREQATAAL
jgi:hypothetical protein